MTRAEQRAQIRILLGETVGDGYTDSEINTAINNSNLVVARDTLALQTSRDLELTAYNDPLLTDPDDPRKFGRYGLPEDFLAMIGVKILSGGRWIDLGKALSFTQFSERSQYVQGGVPSCYYLEFGAVRLDAPKPGDIHLWPYPDQGYTLRRTYYQKPTPMTLDADICELPDTAHLGACYHAAMVLSRKWKDRVLIQEMISLWTDEERRIKAIINVQDLTGSFHVRNVY